MAHANRVYKDKSYWDERFQTEDEFDWCGDYGSFRHLIRADVRATDRILVLGCGNSRLSELMYQDGFTHITNIDYSHVVIDRMRTRHQELERMDWREMDITHLTFQDRQFDVVIEKGTLDSLLVDEPSPWTLSAEAEHLLDTVFSEISRVLTPQGTLLSITFCQPHFRIPHLSRDSGKRYDWSVECETFGEYFHYFYYRMLKGVPLTTHCLQLSAQYSRRRETGTVCDGQHATVSGDDELFLQNMSDIFGTYS